MEIYQEEEYNVTHIPMFQKVVDMFDSRPGFQRIVRLGLLANMGYTDELDDTGEEDYQFDPWAHGQNSSRQYSRPSDRTTGNHTRLSGSVYPLPTHYYAAARDVPLSSSVKVQPKESNAERKARLLQDEKKSKEKADKKRLKKQKQKERRRLERAKQNSVKNNEEKVDEQQTKAEESKAVNDKSNSSASAKDTDSSDCSEDESSDEDGDTKNDSDDSEELDMTSTFVSKAALIAQRKMEQKPRPERKEKKKTPVKGEPKTVPDEPNEDLEAEKKNHAGPKSPTLEDNIKTSTDLANVGNKFASAGDFNMAVKYFTDAIKYNPTEFKLFGNRSFCFEKMQEYTKALADAELSLSMCPGWVKGLFRKGRALAGLKMYEEAAQAFMEVLKLDSTCAEAAQELMRVQITQLMGYGFTREQSSNALIIHGTVNKAVEVLSKLNQQPGAFQNGGLPLAPVANVSGFSPVLSANINTAVPPQSQEAQRAPNKSKPLGPVQNMSNVKTQPKPTPDQATKTPSEGHPPQELFPVWVGNLINPVTEAMITNLFNKAGLVFSVHILRFKRCAFVNYTKQEFCEEAIRRFHGSELNGNKLAVRYPDRIPRGMGISKSALKSVDMQDENVGQNNCVDGRNAAGGHRPFRPSRHVPDYRGNLKP
ncbi:tetratricopeptide repeat protein 31-like isoform X2 [Acanthopagrus latus]|uniref:tetratricopeptide repeat protein 31-like isoform X2 n=1 Tax=Acanthopagrus latus TaxID=8177 RepID=UPI00187BF2EE|nr:tetratricopeptide repeat protein 31-like isoform X2 [Acanthopagrus latus]